MLMNNGLDRILSRNESIEEKGSVPTTPIISLLHVLATALERPRKYPSIY